MVRIVACAATLLAIVACEASLARGRVREPSVVPAVSFGDEIDEIPEAWLMHGARVTPLRNEHRSRAADLAAYAASAYPLRIVRRSLARVVVLEALSVGGLAYSGTTHGRTMYIVFRAEQGGQQCIERELEFSATFHHEMAHLTFLHYGFPHRAWRSCTGGRAAPDADAALAALEGRSGKRLDAERIAFGFVNEYASVNEAEDVSETWSLALLRPDLAAHLAAESEPLSCKLEVVQRRQQELGIVMPGEAMYEPTGRALSAVDAERRARALKQLCGGPSTTRPSRCSSRTFVSERLGDGTVSPWCPQHHEPLSAWPNDDQHP